jgi:hypothetical protein
MDPRAVLDAVVKRKIPSPCLESNPRTPTASNKNMDTKIKLRAVRTVLGDVQKRLWLSVTM